MKSNDHFKNSPLAVVVGLSVTGLGTVRSLARSGIRVIGIDSNMKQASAHTRYCQKVFCKDICDENELLETLIQISKRTKTRPVLFLSADIPVLIVSENREILERHYRFHLPSKNAVSTFMDKALFSVFAKNKGLNIPHSLVIDTFYDINSVAKNMNYPCIVKPAFRNPSWDEYTSDKAFKVLSEDGLIGVCKTHAHLATKFIVQELIPGPDSEVFFCLLCYNASSQLVASFVGRKVYQWPPEMGSTCVAESSFNTMVLTQSIELFDLVNYKGIGSVEFKRDSRDGVFKIMEPTVGRSDLQSAIALHSGPNIPLLAYSEVLNMKHSESTSQRNGVYWINEENFFWWLGSRRGGSLTTDCLRLLKGRPSFALFDVLDIKPFFQFSSQKFLNILAKQSSTSGIAGGLKNVNRSKRLKTMGHLAGG